MVGIENIIPYWLEILAYIGMVITPLLLGGAIWLAVNQWKSGRNTRIAQIMLSITERWDSKEMEESRHAIFQFEPKELKKAIDEADKNNSQELYKLIRVANFFDTVGLMVVEGLLHCETTYRLFGEAEANVHKYYAPILTDPNQGKFFKYFNALHQEFQNECKKEEKKRRKIEKQKAALEEKSKGKRRRVT